VASAAGKTMIAVFASASRRAKLLQIIIGASGTPADAAALFAIRNITVVGTGTAGVTFAADAADGAPSCTTVVNHTIEPTYQAGNKYEVALHQRNTAVWNAPSPDACASNLSGGTVIGIGVQCVVAPATPVNYDITLVWDE
jgi:hypothetical protein